ncbi:MAG: non-heme iron oxygenase ferredoxin subunit, partial [Chloroflexi bacterium]|nr:non-heme iron oxygenase ferredoxin subunit [Chloroflexota bacterium]
MALVKIASVSDPAPGRGKLVETEGKEIALFNVGGAFYAIGDTCTHAGGPLSEGSLQGYSVTCPWHGSLFDVRTGQNTGPPAASPVPSYKVVVQGTDVFV